MMISTDEYQYYAKIIHDPDDVNWLFHYQIEIYQGRYLMEVQCALTEKRAERKALKCLDKWRNQQTNKRSWIVT